MIVPHRREHLTALLWTASIGALVMSTVALFETAREAVMEVLLVLFIIGYILYRRFIDKGRIL